MEILKNQHETFIGFTAWTQSSQVVNISKVVVFDGVTINEGGHYDPTSGKFTCPVDGVYYIAVTLRGNGDNSTICDLKRNSEIIMQLYSHPGITPWNTVSNSILTLCNAGESIFVDGVYSSGSYIHGAPGIPYSTFTVILMNQQSQLSFHSTFDGFSVWGSEGRYFNGEIVTWGEVMLNEGSHFNPDLNTFTCPTDGFYFVTITMYGEGTYVGAAKSPYLMLHLEDENSYNVVTNNRIFHCTQGDEILVKATGFGSNAWDHRSSFSVMLVQEEEPSAASMHSSFLGCSAWKTIDQTYNRGDPVSFDNVWVNEGSAFNTSSGTFTCPVPGIYYVSVNLKKVGTADLNIGVEYQSISILWSEETSSDNPGNTISNSCITRCFSGEEIKAVATGIGALHGDHSKAFTTFTVILMYQY